jgi:hypothetical protein
MTSTSYLIGERCSFWAADIHVLNEGFLVPSTLRNPVV